MRFSVNTEEMMRISQLSNSLTRAVSNAVMDMNKVTSHDDWNCDERDDINRSIVDLKKLFNSLNDTVNEFSSSMGRAAMQVEELMNNSERAIQSADVGFATIYAIPSGDEAYSSATVTTSLQGELFANSFENFTAATMSSTLNICNFNDVQFQ